MQAPTNEQLCAELKQGNCAALDVLIERNLAFVRHMAYGFANQYQRPQTADDLVQEGLIGLMRAAEQFDPERGTLFLTYAVSWVKKYMQDFLVNFIVAETVCLDDITEAAEISTSDFWGNGYIQSPEVTVIQKESIGELYHALQVISDRERAYLWYRFGFPNEPDSRTRKETAQHFHLSESRAKSTEITALDNVRLELPWWYGE